MQPHDATYYGQGEIAFYRTYATPLSVRPPPESNFKGKPNTIVGASLWAVVSGPAFQSCYTRGDNSMLVPTQSFANFIHQHADKYTGATLEGFVDFVARRFLATYPHMTAMRVTARDIPFVPVRVPERDGFIESDALYKRSEDEHATVAMEYERNGDEVVLRAQLCGLANLNLVKMHDNSFVDFPMDEYNTVVPRAERVLFLAQDFFWRYANANDAFGGDRYVAAELVRDVAQTTWHEEKNLSIQHLQHQICRRVFQRFPQLVELQIRRRNAPWTLLSAEDARIKVYTDRLPYGDIAFGAHRHEFE